MKKQLIISGFIIGLTACSAADNVPANKGAQNALPNIVISSPQVRPPLPGRDIAAGYFKLTSDQADRLLAVSSPASPRVELHTHIEDKGILRMRRINGGLEIPAGGEVIFEPGGYHIMLFNTSITPDTEDISLTFDFEIAPDVTIIADISVPDIAGESYGSSHGSGNGASHGSGSGSEGGFPHGSGPASGESGHKNPAEKAAH